MLANAGQFSYEDAKAQVPQFWQAHFAAGKGAVVMGTYGINIDAEMGNETFEYLIADPCDPTREAPAGFVKRTIPAFTWVVFPCVGPMPTALQDVNTYTPAPGTAPARRPCRHRYTAFPPCQAFGSDCCRPLP